MESEPSIILELAQTRLLCSDFCTSDIRGQSRSCRDAKFLGTLCWIEIRHRWRPRDRECTLSCLLERRDVPNRMHNMYRFERNIDNVLVEQSTRLL